MKPVVFKLPEPDYRLLLLRASEAKRLRRAMLKIKRSHNIPVGDRECSICAVIDRALRTRKP